MVVPVLMMSCQVSEKRKIGPVTAQTTMIGNGDDERPSGAENEGSVPGERHEKHPAPADEMRSILALFWVSFRHFDYLVRDGERAARMLITRLSRKAPALPVANRLHLNLDNAWERDGVPIGNARFRAMGSAIAFLRTVAVDREFLSRSANPRWRHSCSTARAIFII